MSESAWQQMKREKKEESSKRREERKRKRKERIRKNGWERTPNPKASPK